jgi:hypothetical protein
MNTQELRNGVLGLMNESTRNARRYCVRNHGPLPPPPTLRNPNHLSAKGKDERGINHDLTGYLLCPIDFDWD